MANASTKTLLSLDRFFALIGLHPLLGNQVTAANITTTDAQCGIPLLKYAWQNADAVGREEVAFAIADAEDRLAGLLRFRPMPTWNVAEIGSYPRPYDPTLIASTGRDIRDRWNTVRTQFGYILSGGVEAKTLIDAAAAVVYSDTDSDGYKETATITAAVPVGVTNPEEIALYYPGTDAADDWEIRPITARIASGVATIVCQRAQLVDPDLLDKMTPVPVDGLIDGNFLTTVDVYRHWNDPQTQVEFQWDANSCCASDSGLAGAYSIQAGVLNSQDKKLGLVALQPGTWNATADGFDSVLFSGCRAPDRVRLWYYAGWQWKNSLTRIDPLWERAIAYLALCYLDRPFCACESISSYTDYWRQDIALRRNNQQSASSYMMANRLLGNPLGTMRGQVYAWEQVLRYYLPETVYD